MQWRGETAEDFDSTAHSTLVLEVPVHHHIETPTDMATRIAAVSTLVLGSVPETMGDLAASPAWNPVVAAEALGSSAATGGSFCEGGS